MLSQFEVASTMRSFSCVVVVMVCLWQASAFSKLIPSTSSAGATSTRSVLDENGKGGIVRRSKTSSSRRQAEAVSSEPSPWSSSSIMTANANVDRQIPLWPCNDKLDGMIWKLALPAMLNLAIMPLVGAADTFWVGRMKDALALAGQGAANQIFSSAFWIISFLPSVVTPLVAKAASENDKEQIQERIGEAMFIATIMGTLGCIGLSFVPEKALNLVLDPTSGARKYAEPYLTIRALTLLPSLLSTVAFASFRGTMDVVTPLKISLFSNFVNCILDPLLIFNAGMGMAGAAAATCTAEIISFVLYMRELWKKQMVRTKSIKIPSLKSIQPLLLGGLGVQLRAVSLNVAFLAVTRTTQALDKTGTAAAAHTITVQLWQLGGVVLLALSVTAGILVPQERFKKVSDDGKKLTPLDSVKNSRTVANRMLRWGFILGIVLGAFQISMLPLLNVFSPLPEVQQAARLPSIIGAILQVLNGVVFVGEGIQQGNQAFVPLAVCTAIASCGMLTSLKFYGNTLAGVWGSFAVFNGIRLIGVIRHHYFSGPLVLKKATGKDLLHEKVVSR